MSELSENQQKDIEKAEGTSVKELAPQFVKAIIDKIRGKEIRKQLAFLLDPDNIETSSRLKRNEVMSVNNADWLGRHIDRLEPLREFWVGVANDTDKFKRGGGYARWVCSEGGKRIEEAISFIGASKEEKILAPVISAMKEKGETSK